CAKVIQRSTDKNWKREKRVFGDAPHFGSTYQTPQTLRVCFAVQQSWTLTPVKLPRQGMALPARAATSKKLRSQIDRPPHTTFFSLPVFGHVSFSQDKFFNLNF
ncbi:MAG: hypothetical protein Q7T03_06665, partial [Deltaproteobacteria bacterium]|nr:hypothetical protein [Deltaproteobacteria bacterium]